MRKKTTMSLFNKTNNSFEFYHNNDSWAFDLRPDSGKVIERPKFGFGIDHTGIILGNCSYSKKLLVIHNHRDRDRASIVYLDEFSAGNEVSYSNYSCSNPPNVVLENALQTVFEGKQYRVLSSNCQHLTSQACNNKAVSKDLNKGVLLGGLAATFLGVAYLSSTNE